MTAEFKGLSGADIIIRVAPFKDAMALKNTIGAELARNGINLPDLDFGENGSDVKDVLPAILNAVLTLDSSPKVNEAIFSCLARCTYNGEKISEDTFEEVEARGDYYEVVVSCLKENLAPFFAGQLSKLSAKGLTIDSILK